MGHKGMFTDYIIANPTENITALVTAPVKPEERAQVVKEIFENEPTCEQVGFVEFIDENSISLEMMGGEFCGNATISSAAYMAESYGMPVYEDMNVNVCAIVSGVEQELSVYVLRKKDIVREDNESDDVILRDNQSGQQIDELVVPACDELYSDTGSHKYEGTVKMPIPTVGELHGYPLVNMQGISHLLIPTEDMSHEEAEKLVKEYAEELDVPALGFVLYSEIGSGTAGVQINPLVYVKGSDTLFWEHGCATGSTAIGYYRFAHDGIRRTEVSQPGGMITVKVLDEVPQMTGSIIL